MESSLSIRLLADLSAHIISSPIPFRNAARVAAISYVSGGVVFVGKVFITTLTTGIAYFAIDHYVGDELYSIIGPLFFIAAIA